MMSLGIAILIVVVCFFTYLVFSKGQQETVSSGSGYAPAFSSKGGKNNPGFLIHTNINWQGKEESTGCKFENFSSLNYGVRAWYVNLFGKVKNGTITNTNQMIDILTPAGKENSEVARNNYKASVARATNWLELGVAVFNFEANPDWLNSSYQTEALQTGFQSAVQYIFGQGNVPAYFK